MRSESYSEWVVRVEAEHRENMKRLADSTRRYRAFNDGLEKRLGAS